LEDAHKWVDNIKMYLVCGVESSGSGQGPAAGSCENGNETSDSTKTAILT
jgi:hypothetical protein